MPGKITPSDGERAALAGYIPQYRIAAELIYRSLTYGTLEWLKLADPEAGRVDDIQIATNNRLDAYQVKWGRASCQLSFNELITDKKRGAKPPKPSLINQLADGWIKLKTVNPDRQVHVHLITRDIPSVSAKIPIDDDPPANPDFPGFISDCWDDRKWSRGGLEATPKGWRQAIQKIQAASKLKDDDFINFLQSTELHFGHQIPSESIYRGRDDERRESKINEIVTLLMHLVANGRRTVQVMRESLLHQLGWEKVFNKYFIHDFHVDELYQPIKSTVAELETSLQNYKQGYMALLGTPGSGKSTILSQCLRYRKNSRIIRYYAFVPDSPTLGRGEAMSFLHDLYISLREQGVYGKEDSHPTLREEFLRKISDQLAELGDKWRKEHIPTFILVDGLDHIEREQSPQRSLILDLPHPSTIPEGVLFILGTQKLELQGMSPAIQAELEESGRTLVMRPLDREAVHAILDKSSMVGNLSHDQKDKVCELSAGHPLALSYLVKRLCKAEDVDELGKILNETDPYIGHIDKAYETYWKSLDSDEDIRTLLGLMARVRIVLDLNELVTWINETTVLKLVRTARHFFFQETDVRWRFFHNSFRQFLLRKTAINIVGQPDPQVNRNFHQRLAEISAKKQVGDIFSWEELYHRACSEDWEAVVKLGTQTNFRNQLFAFRQYSAIKEDISILLHAAQQISDGMAIIRSFLIEHELTERQYNLNQVDFPELLFELKGPAFVTDYVFEGRRLRIDQVKALGLCGRLARIGMLELAHKIFDVAEPLDILVGTRKIEVSGKLDLKLLEAWAEVAYLFKSADKLFSVIEQLQADEERAWSGADAAEVTNQVRDFVKQVLIDSVAKNADIETINSFKTSLTQKGVTEKVFRRINLIICLNRPGTTEANLALNELLYQTNPSDLDDQNRALLAEIVLRKNGNKEEAAKWIEGIAQPVNYKWKPEMEGWTNLSPFRLRLRLTKVLSALGKPIDPILSVPNNDPLELGEVLFERNLIIAANVWGQALSGESAEPIEVAKKLQPTLSLFHHDHLETKEWRGWYELRSAAMDFYDLVVKSAAAYGKEAVCELSKTFGEVWENTNTKRYWPDGWILHVSLELFRNGDFKDVLIKRLEGLEASLEVWDGVEDRIRIYAELALAWQEAKVPRRAMDIMTKLMEASFGIYQEKDYRFSLWTEWLCKIGNMRPDLTVEDVRRFAGALVVLHGSRRGRGNQDAAVDFMSLVARWYPASALELFVWLLDQHAIYYSAGIEGILTGAFQSTNPPIEMIVIITQYLLIPFGSGAPIGFIKKLIEQGIKNNNEKKMTSIVEEIATAIEIKSMPSDRNKCWQTIVEVLNSLGISTGTYEERLKTSPRNSESNSGTTFVMKTGETLAEDSAKLHSRSFKEFISFIQKVEDAKYIQWESLLAPLIDIATYEETHSLQENLKRFNPGVVVRSKLAKRLIELGYVDEARSILESLLPETTARGWDRHWDGGGRLSVIEGLIAVDSGYWRPKAVEMLIQDYIDEFRDPLRILYNLNSIVRLLFKEQPTEELWREITEHVYQIHEFSKAENLPAPLHLHPVDISHEEMLVMCLEVSATMPILEMKEAVHHVLHRLISLDLGHVAIQRLIEKLLNNEGLNTIQGLAIIEAIIDVRPDFAARFNIKINELCDSPDLSARQLALQLAQRLGITLETRPTNTKRLPPIYALHLPPLQTMDELFPVAAIAPGNPFPDTKDALEMVRPFDYLFILLNKISGIPIENLLERGAELMRKLVPENKWNKNAEQQIQAWLKSADLEITYCRPRPQMARLALNYILTELIDSGNLDKKQIDQLESILRRHDRRLLSHEPVKRPDGIIVPELRESRGMSYTDWIKNAKDAIPSMMHDHKNKYIVLGELTRFRGLDWETPTETRMAMVCHHEWPEQIEVEKPSDLFPYNSFWCAEDYPELERTKKWYSTVVYGHPHVDMPRTNWLAFHPLIAERLGWHLDTAGLFRWLNSEGQTMVESLWWQDGPCDRLPPHLYDVCGEGWIVIASKDAERSILAATGKVARLVSVIREYRDSDIGHLQEYVVQKKPWDGQ